MRRGSAGGVWVLRPESGGWGVPVGAPVVCGGGAPGLGWRGCSGDVGDGAGDSGLAPRAVPRLLPLTCSPRPPPTCRPTAGGAGDARRAGAPRGPGAAMSVMPVAPSAGPGDAGARWLSGVRSFCKWRLGRGKRPVLATPGRRSPRRCQAAEVRGWRRCRDAGGTIAEVPGERRQQDGGGAGMAGAGSRRCRDDGGGMAEVSGREKGKIAAVPGSRSHPRRSRHPPSSSPGSAPGTEVLQAAPAPRGARLGRTPDTEPAWPCPGADAVLSPTASVWLLCPCAPHR